MIRLNKLIAESGLCSRREADRLIEAGAVTVNGQVVTALGTQVHPEQDRVLLDGNPLPKLKTLYLVLYKPSGYITTRKDPQGRPTIYDLIPAAYQSVDPAGRLDRDSSGVLILSNDGDFINHVTHPRYHLSKVYRVRVKRPLTEKILTQLQAGVMLEPEGKLAEVKEISWEKPDTVKLTLITGYNRQIRRSFEALGCEVASLKRLSVGPITVGSLKPGEIRALTQRELLSLRPPNRKIKRAKP